jgi:hypothetical protein
MHIVAVNSNARLSISFAVDWVCFAAFLSDTKTDFCRDSFFALFEFTLDRDFALFCIRVKVRFHLLSDGIQSTSDCGSHH